MITDGDGVRGGMGSFMVAQILGEKPKFNGSPENWQNFANEWRRYLETVEGAMGELKEGLKIELLRGCLDEVSRQELQRQREASAFVRFEDVWRTLESEFQGDYTSKQKTAWKNHILVTKTNLTYANWRQFATQFAIYKNRVWDRAPQEERELALKQLPEYWQLELVKEENKRRRG